MHKKRSLCTYTIEGEDGMREKREPQEWLCTCDLTEGTKCRLDNEGRILCPHCGLPIRSQLKMEKKDDGVPWDFHFPILH